MDEHNTNPWSVAPTHGLWNDLMGQTQHKPHGLLHPNPWSAPQLTVAVCVLLRAGQRKESTDDLLRMSAHDSQGAACCKAFKKPDLKSSHKSKCKQFIQGCGMRTISVQPHQYAGGGGISWEFMRTAYPEASGKSNYSYCAKYITTDPESDWSQVRAAAKEFGGCRRPYGSGPGFCNGRTQQSCVRSSTCACTLTHHDLADDDTNSSNVARATAARAKIEQLIVNWKPRRGEPPRR